MRGAGYAVLMIALWCLVRAALNGDLLSLEAPAMYALPVGFALMAAAYVQKSLSRLKFGRFISMGLIVGIGYALYILVYLIMGGGGIRLGTVWNQTFLGAKLGAAMGLGFELIDLIGSRPEHEPRPGPGRW
jgi:RsiW-degrading membrane proteinase PrsW (M82 family)